MTLRLSMVFAALFSGAAALAAPPHRVVIEYDMSRNDMVMAELKETLEHDGKSYRIVSEGKGKGIFAVLARGTVSRTSEGEVTAQGLMPREYRDRRGSNRSASAKFDRAARTLVQQKDDKAPETEPLPERAQDRLSYLWSLAFVPPKGHVQAMVADGRGAPVRYDYAVAGVEVLKTAVGDLETLHLVKQRTPDDSRQTEVWLAVKRDYIPVRVLVVEKDGTRLDQVVTRIEG